MTTQAKPAGDAARYDRAAAPRPVPNPAVVHRTVDDGALLFLPTTETYFGLNATGALVWAHIARACDDVDALCEALARRHPEVDPASIADDVRALVAALAEHGLVTLG